MARGFSEFIKGVQLIDNTTTPNAIGDLSGSLTSADNGAIYHYSNKIKFFLNGSETEAVGTTLTQTLTNKVLSDSTTTFGYVSDTTKALKFSLGGAITAKTLTLASAHTNDRTITFPDITDTLVSLTASQTLTNKAISGGTVSALTGFSLRDTSAAFDVTLASTSSSALTAGRTLTLDMVNAARSIKLQGNIDLGGTLTTASSLTTSGANGLTLTTTGTTNVTLPTSGTLYGTAASSITSSQLAASLSDETGTGSAVFASGPTLTRPKADNFVKNYTTTATSGGVTTLSVSSAGIQYFTGTTTQNVVLPDATTLPQAGFQFFIVNLSTGALTIKDNGSNALGTLPASSFGWVTAKDISTTNGSWDISQSLNNAGSGTVTSVAQTVPAHLSVAGSPITTSGTLALTLSGSPIAMANGTAAAPSYNFGASTSTGMYSSSANVLDWSTNGTQRLELGTSLSLVGQTRIVGASYNDTSNNSQLDIRNVNTTKDVSTRVASFGLTGANDMTGSLFLLFYDGDGNIGSVSVASSTSVAYNTTSDKRLKTNVQDFSALSIIENMEPISFEFKKELGRTFHGFLAQDLYEVYPEAVTKGSNDNVENPETPWSMDYGKLTPVCIKGIQELRDQIEELRAEIEILKSNRT
jgi:hypothetical protein